MVTKVGINGFGRIGRIALRNAFENDDIEVVAVNDPLIELHYAVTGMSKGAGCVANGSVVDLTCRIEKSTDYEETVSAVKKAADRPLKGILGYTDGDVVSTEMKGSTHSSIFDIKASIALNKNYVKLVSWYDNEWGNSRRALDLVAYVAKADAGE